MKWIGDFGRVLTNSSPFVWQIVWKIGGKFQIDTRDCADQKRFGSILFDRLTRQICSLCVCVSLFFGGHLPGCHGADGQRAGGENGTSSSVVVASRPSWRSALLWEIDYTYMAADTIISANGYHTSNPTKKDLLLPKFRRKMCEC
jgi:hypothetical protein